MDLNVTFLTFKVAEMACSPCQKNEVLSRKTEPDWVAAALEWLYGGFAQLQIEASSGPAIKVFFSNLMKDMNMAVAKVIEVIAGSKISFEDAIKQGIDRASETVSEVTSAWVKDQSVVLEAGKIVEFRVTMKLTFIIKAAGKAAKKK
jgi:dodecin